jgi:ABC-2 type transport system permease protein
MSYMLPIIFNETHKRLLLLWNYKFNIVTQFVTVILLFIGAVFFVQGGEFDPGQMPALLLGYIIWFYARIVIMSTSSDLISEAQAGTLEQMYMSPVNTDFLLLGRVLALLVSTTIMVLLPALGLVLLFHIHITLSVDALLPLLLTLIGLFGFSLALSGAALVFKQVEALSDLVQNALLFLTGSLVPVSHFPEWLALISKALPITQGIIVLRDMLLQGQTLAAAWADGSLIWLTIHAVIYVSIGLVIFRWGERIAKQQGSLGQY